MTESRESFLPGGITSEGGKESGRSAAERGHRRTPSREELAHRLEILRARDTEEPDGRWFLPLAIALRDLGNLEEAGQTLRRGLAKDPDCLGGWVVLAQCYVAMGELEVARGLFEWVLARDRENPLVLRGLAQLMALKGERRRAADGFRALLRVMPRDLAAQEALASLLEPEIGEPEPIPTRPRKLEAPPRVFPPRGVRPMLPPEPDVDRGIFEPVPADLDWKGPAVAERRARSDSAPKVPAGSTERSPHQGDGIPQPRSERSLAGYRRWIERMMDRSGQGSDAGGDEPAAGPAEPSDAREPDAGERSAERCPAGDSPAGPFVAAGE